MKNLTTTSLRVRENQLWILDQQALPQQSDWRPCPDVAALVDHIRTLRVRGAPLIGLSASLLLALLAEGGMPQPELHQALDTLRESRPTAVNLMNNLDRMKAVLTQTISFLLLSPKHCGWWMKTAHCATALPTTARSW